MSELTLVHECQHLVYKKGNLKVLLGYPGAENVGFSSLSLHRIYSLLNSIEGISCDLIFEGMESSYFLGINPKEFDVIAFTVTYENHLFKIVELLLNWEIEPLREKRKNSPLIIGGGIGLYYNPVPFLPILDAVYLGEAEGRIEEVFQSLVEKPSIESLDKFDNVVLSENYTFSYDGPKVVSISGERKKIYRSTIFRITPSHSCFISESTTFNEMFLIELNRGCVEKCRFCVASYMGLPYREKDISVVEREIEIASKYVSRVGLIGAGVTDYSRLEELYEVLKKYSMRASFSSMKASSTSPFIFEILKESGQKTVTLAPEAGSEELRFAINKKVKDERYFEFAEKCLESGAENLKLYFLIGLPGETNEDIEKIPEMAQKFVKIATPFWKERGKRGEVHLSINPVIAKPFTPFQWYGLNSKGTVEKKLKKISKLVRKLPGVSLTYEKPKEAVLQAIISRGDTRIGEAAVKSVKERAPFRRVIKEIGLPFEELYTREREKKEVFPWDFIESRIDKGYLWMEYRNTYERKATPACFPGCRVCGLCK